MSCLIYDCLIFRLIVFFNDVDSISILKSRESIFSGVVPNSDPCQIITPLVLVGLGLGLGVGEGLGLGNHIAISTRGVIIWQGVENGHNTGINFSMHLKQDLINVILIISLLH